MQSSETFSHAQSDIALDLPKRREKRVRLNRVGVKTAFRWEYSTLSCCEKVVDKISAQYGREEEKNKESFCKLKKILYYQEKLLSFIVYGVP